MQAETIYNSPALAREAAEGLGIEAEGKFWFELLKAIEEAEEEIDYRAINQTGGLRWTARQRPELMLGYATPEERAEAVRRSDESLSRYHADPTHENFLLATTAPDEILFFCDAARREAA